MSQVEIASLSLTYGKALAFRDVSLGFQPQSITALVGPSGCGKTSLLQCINRLVDLIPEAKISGSLEIDGVDIYADTIDLVMLRRKVGMIFQKPSPFPFSIRKNFHLALREHGVRSRLERDQIMQKALEDVGLWKEVAERLDSSAIKLSGGQQQRLCIARALALEPKVLLFDEPCSALDPISSAVVEDLIKKLGEKYTVVVVTHNLAQARRIADRVAFFWQEDGVGVLVEEGAVDEMFNSPKEELTAAYVNGARG